MPAVKRVFEGLTLVAVGAILLANTLGVLSWSVWWTIFSLWPLLIVSAGLDILGKATNSSALRVLSSLVVIGGLAYGVLAGAGRVNAPVFEFGGRAPETFSASAPVGSATTARAHVSAGATRLTVRDGSDLARAAGTSPFGKPSFSTKTSGGATQVDIGSADGSWVGAPGNLRRSSLDVMLGRDVTWEEVKVDAVAAEISMDLRALRFKRLQAGIGMSSARIEFGAMEPEAEAVINGGMSLVRVRVPRDLGVELRADNGLGSVDVRGGGWTRTSGNGAFSGTWRTDGYDSAPSKLALVVKTGLSSVEVERY